MVKTFYRWCRECQQKIAIYNGATCKADLDNCPFRPHWFKARLAIKKFMEEKIKKG